MSEYRFFVHNLAINNVNQVFLNSDAGKMLDVYSEIFANSRESVRIFAGNLCNDSMDSSDYIEALSDFIERKGNLRILLNNFDIDVAKKTNLYKRLAYYKAEGADIQIKSTPAKPYILVGNGDKRINVHFAVGDNVSYRLENDTENRTAICNMSDPETASKYADIFDKIFSNDSSKTVDLNAVIPAETK